MSLCQHTSVPSVPSAATQAGKRRGLALKGADDRGFITTVGPFVPPIWQVNAVNGAIQAEVLPLEVR